MQKKPPIRIAAIIVGFLLGISGCQSTVIAQDVDPSVGTLTDRPPNILFYILDDVGLEPMPQYPDQGLPKAVTPTMDALAADGIVFDNVWVNPMCGPTRSTLVTGQYVSHSGYAGGPRARLTEDHMSLQRYLDANAPTDYATGAFGKWHVNEDPNALGVEYYAGLLGNIGRQNSYYAEWTFTENGTQTQRSDYATTVTTDYAIDWIDRQDGGPWFAWIAHQSPHGPFHTPPEGMYTSNAGKSDLSNLENYIAMLESVDQELARLLDSLEPAERAATTVIVLGDNGTPGPVMRGSRGRAKGSVYEGGIRVPMIVAGNGVTREGEREPALVNGTDLFATIAELAGADLAVYEDSISQLALFTDRQPGPRRYAYSEDDVGRDAMTWTVRNERYKLIVAPESEELYDLSADPGERANLLDTDAVSASADAAAAELRAIGARIHADDADSFRAARP
ncbi:MAG: sulfatase-like hydrolase/transferase [Pseudomonadota bacterium]